MYEPDTESMMIRLKLQEQRLDSLVDALRQVYINIEWLAKTGLIACSLIGLTFVAIITAISIT